ncbi:DUF6316 family protein [Pseudoteredinibacter isoporae]|uniref:DUF6316 family protein n=1 Tax=Pseudoteredinibacter isoporae TaxID=570281 RepID=UPI003103694E
MKALSTEPRKGEAGRIPPRSERCFKSGDYWYYSTREQIDIGPFDDRDQATAGVDAFVEFVCEKPTFSDTLKRYKSAA